MSTQRLPPLYVIVPKRRKMVPTHGIDIPNDVWATRQEAEEERQKFASANDERVVRYIPAPTSSRKKAAQ